MLEIAPVGRGVGAEAGADTDSERGWRRGGEGEGAAEVVDAVAIEADLSDPALPMTPSPAPWAPQG